MVGALSIFFFQAEDGIRDGTVTGVQTCALPISVDLLDTGTPASSKSTAIMSKPAKPELARILPELLAWRSEERRVGKECRSRWSVSHEKKKGTCYCK